MMTFLKPVLKGITTYTAIFVMMKLLFLFLSLYLLVLSCIPCNDSKECNMATPVEVYASNNHQEHNHSKEACTPFCTCSCCAASAFYNPISKAQIVKEDFQSIKYPIHNENLNTEVSYSIWQPPKIAA